MLVQNMWCNGSHGISVGSLGQYAGETDIVENIYVYNVTMSESFALFTHTSMLMAS
jgi:galacturan 1,4-alpha-galacturonidase